MFLAVIENINITVNLDDDKVRYFDYFKKFIECEMVNDKLQSVKNKDELFLYDGCEILPVGIQRYPYGYSFKNRYKIFFASNTGDNYPIYVSICAMELHLRNVQDVLDDVKKDIEKIIKHYDPAYQIDFYDIKMSRVDICNHNTEINLKTYIKPDEYNARTVTQIRVVRPYVELKGEFGQEVTYFRYGQGDICVRFYNKIKEVCEQQYKPFFLKKWLDNGLIDDKTFKIYEDIYKKNDNYRLDYMYYNIKNNPMTDEESRELEMINSNIKLKNDDKYDLYKSIIKRKKIKCCDEVVNVEFQLRSAFLRSLRLKDKEGKEIDYTDINMILVHADILYEYLTTDVFRVVVRDSNYKRKRNREIDPAWKNLQNSKIMNVGSLKIEADVYRNYNSDMDLISSTNKAVKNMVTVFYQTVPIFNKSVVDNSSIDDLLNIVKLNYDMNENYYNLQYKLMKQIKYNGEKNPEYIDSGINLESDNEEQ